eukprot:3390136-Pyramimonas_sp.AAC.1
MPRWTLTSKPLKIAAAGGSKTGSPSCRPVAPKRSWLGPRKVPAAAGLDKTQRREGSFADWPCRPRRRWFGQTPATRNEDDQKIGSRAFAGAAGHQFHRCANSAAGSRTA